MWFDLGLDLLLQVIRKTGNIQSDQITCIRYRGCRAAGIGQDTNAPSPQWRLSSQRPAMCIEIFDTAHPYYSGLLQDTVIKKIRTGHGARMTRSGTRTGCRTADILSNDRFMTGNSAGNIHKSLTIPNSFNIKDNGLCLFVFPQILQRVHNIYISLVTQTNCFTETNSSFS